MSLMFTSVSANPPAHGSRLGRNSLSNPNFFWVGFNTLQVFLAPNVNSFPLVRKKPSFVVKESINSADTLFTEDSSISLDLEDHEGEVDDLESPWEGAVIYQRNPSTSHMEYCTTLERLGLGELSTNTSKSRASVMGLRVTKAIKDFPQGTPVLISADVTRMKQKLRLDGIVRTVITLACNGCGEPTAESIFSNFTLLLSEEPVEEPDIINLGVIFGDDLHKPLGNEEEDDLEALIDPDDQLYFPPDQKAIDISKQIRDLLHIEITINAVCDPTCKGLCLHCGSNLNTSTCKYSNDVKQGIRLGPLKDLKKQMQKK